VTPERPTRHPALQLGFAEGGRLRASVPGREPLVASREVLDVLALCSGERAADEIAAGLGWPDVSPAAAAVVVRETLARLAAAGLVIAAEERPPAPTLFGYAHPWIHRTMLRDRVRTEAFRAALAAVVRPGDVVIDVGAGTGVLSLFAAQAGARRVHAVEATAAADLAAELARANGLEDRVVVHRGDAREVELEPADVLVSEWLGHLALTEGMFPAVAAVRDRWLRPDGRIVPAAVDLSLAPAADDADPPEGWAFWTGRPYGLDLSPALAAEERSPQSYAERIAPERLMAAPARIHRLDCRTAGLAELSFAADVELALERGGPLLGLAGWFAAELAPGVVLDTAPTAPPTHWRQHVLPLRPLRTQRGDRLRVRLRLDGGDRALPEIALDVTHTGAGGATRLETVLNRL